MEEEMAWPESNPKATRRRIPGSKWNLPWVIIMTRKKMRKNKSRTKSVNCAVEPPRDQNWIRTS
jgi:hypothetical protein